MTDAFVRKFRDKSITRERLIGNTECDTIVDAIIKNSRDEISLQIFCSALAIIKDDGVLYDIVKDVLPKLNRDNIQTKQLNDFYSRLSIELSKPNHSPEFILKIALLCEEYITIGDAAAPFYKDVLPVALAILQKNNSTIEYNGKALSGRKHTQTIIENVLKDFPSSIITAIVSMFKDIELSQSQHDALITKVSQMLHNVPPQDIGSLSLATFQTALFNQLLLPILALDKYFHKHRYKKEINESASDMDSIDDAADAGIIEVEEIVIYHFQDVAEYTTIERDLTNAIKSLEFTPKFILTPFISTFLMSIAKISSSVEGNFNLNQSTLLPLLKQMFKFNVEHREILRTSGWANSIDERSEIVNTDALLNMLKQNTCALKQNIALNGLFALSFLLLKTKASPELNKFAIEFLNEIICNRREFTGDIMKIVVKMLYCESNKTPIVQCLTSFLNNRHLDINASKSALESLIQDLTELDMDTAIAIESAVFSAISKSVELRDDLIDIMKTAMYHKNPQVRKKAVVFFCVMLRHQKPPRLSASHHSLNESRFAHNISFFSLTQSQIPISNVNSNVRQVEIMMLEILGMLRKCFSDTCEIKRTMYDSLLNSIAANTFVVSSVLEFIELHFREYFDCEGEDVINFDRALKTTNNQVIAIDDLGCLLKFIINCVKIASSRNDRENCCDLTQYYDILYKLVEKVLNSTLSSFKFNEGIEMKHTIIIPQLLTIIQELMVFSLHEAAKDSSHVEKISILFEKHEKIKEKTKKLTETKGKKKSDTRVTTEKIEINYSSCIWDLKECSEFLKFMSSDDGDKLKADKEFCMFLWHSTNKNIEKVHKASEHNPLRHSRSTFDSFLSCIVELYEELTVEKFSQSYEKFGFDCIQIIAEAFCNAAHVTQTAFYNKKEKLSTFLRALTKKKTSDDDDMLAEVISRIEKVIEWCFEKEKTLGEFINSSGGNSLLSSLFTAMQIFANSFRDINNTQGTFSWIVNFCKTTNNVKQKSLASIIIKLLLQSLSQQENSSIIDCLSHRISSKYKYRNESEMSESATQNNFVIISKHTVDGALMELIDFMGHQLSIIEVYIKRANSYNAHARLKTESHSDTVNSLQTMEIAIATKLVTLGKSLERVANSTFPLHSSKFIEKLTSIIRAYYNCLTNLMKHYKKHHNIKNIHEECKESVSEVVKYSKAFDKAIYSLVKYVGSEAANLAKASSTKDDKKTKSGGVGKGANAVLNKTKKSIPKVIFMLESFHKSVVDYDQAAKTNLARLLHPGEVRDFHIDTNFIANNNDDDEDEEEGNSSDDEVSKVALISSRKRKAPVLSDATSSDDENQVLSSDRDDVSFTRKRFEENLRKIEEKRTRSKKK